MDAETMNGETPRCHRCSYPMFEQYKAYPGHWYCFHPKTLNRENRRITICHTPVQGDEYQVLFNATTPEFCPLIMQMERRAMV